MTRYEKKRKAAVIAATIYLNMEEEKDKKVSQYGWRRMGMVRRMNDRKLLFSNGRTIGARII
ncbi:hypothetical protein [Mariniflexile sp.]|uniref:hypothetical protein n=1 Tax=Mariniflexile sp. TaxID=1979402 RepID=UPI0035680109